MKVLTKGPVLVFLSFADVGYHAAGRIILESLNLEVNRGETLVLLGISGSGKTTVLRLITRMWEATSGEILLEGRNIRSLDPIALRRRIGYVIQEFGLLPHWTVEQNIELVPRLLDWPVERRRERSDALASQMGLKSMLGRYPHQLSGGQRQRVAVARALAAEPSLLLFDEPFGALDPVTRYDMQQLFLSLRDQYGGASIFVTHDVLEALKLGTRIAVLADGKLEGVFTPEEFLHTDSKTARSFLQTLPEALRANGSA